MPILSVRVIFVSYKPEAHKCLEVVAVLRHGIFQNLVKATLFEYLVYHPNIAKSQDYELRKTRNFKFGFGRGLSATFGRREYE
jgi:hypothetical protein